MEDTNLLNDQARLRAALESVRPEAEALPPAREKRVTANVPLASAVAVRAMQRLRALRERAARLRSADYDDRCFDRLEILALAAFQAHAVALAAATPSSRLPELAERALRRRRELLDDIRPLSNRGLLDLGRLAKLKGGTGHFEVATDLAIITEVLRQAWPNIAESTPISEADLGEVELLSQTLLVTLALRDEHPEEAESAARLERRVFTLFAEAYAQVRRAVVFLRWDEGDADEIAPSIHDTGYRRARRAEEQDVAPSPAAAATQSASGVAVAQPAPRVPEGDPNSAPFEH